MVVYREIRDKRHYYSIKVEWKELKKRIRNCDVKSNNFLTATCDPCEFGEYMLKSIHDIIIG